MAQLIVRNLPDELVKRLRRRAAEHGRSAEAEHREILRAALGAEGDDVSIKDALVAMPPGGTAHDFARRPSHGRRVKL